MLVVAAAAEQLAHCELRPAVASAAAAVHATVEPVQRLLLLPQLLLPPVVTSAPGFAVHSEPGAGVSVCLAPPVAEGFVHWGLVVESSDRWVPEVVGVDPAERPLAANVAIAAEVAAVAELLDLEVVVAAVAAVDVVLMLQLRLQHLPGLATEGLGLDPIVAAAVADSA